MQNADQAWQLCIFFNKYTELQKTNFSVQNLEFVGR